MASRDAVGYNGDVLKRAQRAILQCAGGDAVLGPNVHPASVEATDLAFVADTHLVGRGVAGDLEVAIAAGGAGVLDTDVLAQALAGSRRIHVHVKDASHTLVRSKPAHLALHFSIVGVLGVGWHLGTVQSL